MIDEKSESSNTALVHGAPEVASTVTPSREQTISDVVDPTNAANQRIPADMRVAAAGRTYVTERFTSPLPPPEILERYSKIPGALEQVLRVLEKQQDHGHAMEREDLSIVKQESIGAIDDAKAARAQARIGQITSTIICLASIVVGAIICIYGTSVYAPFAGGLIGIGGPATIVAILVTGKHPKDGKRSLPREAAKLYSDKTSPALSPPSAGGPPGKDH